MSPKTREASGFNPGIATAQEEIYPVPHYALSSTSKVAQWCNLISSDMWEAVIMFVAYLATRWYSYLRGTAIFLQVYVLAVIVREVVVDFGNVILRAVWWLHLAKYGYVKLPWSLAHQWGSELSGFLILAAAIPLLPFYLCALVVFVSSAALRKSKPVATVRQKLGIYAYDIFLARYLRAGAEGALGVRCRRNQSGDMSLPSDHSNQDSVSNWQNKLMRKCRQWKRQSVRRLTLCLLIPVLIFLFTIFMIISVHNLIYAAVKIAVLAIGAILLFCALLSLVLVTGAHVCIFLAIGLEIVTSILGIELETGAHELRIWACFCIPILIFANKVFCEKLISATLSALRNDLGPEHRLSRISQIYSEIPLNGAQIAIKVSDRVSKKTGQAADRHPAYVAMTLQEGSEIGFQCDIIDGDDDAAMEELRKSFREGLHDRIVGGSSLKREHGNMLDCIV